MEFYNVQAAEGKVAPNSAPLTDKSLQAHVESALAAARKAQALMRDTISERNRIRILKITLWVSVIVGLIALLYLYARVWIVAH